MRLLKLKLAAHGSAFHDILHASSTWMVPLHLLPYGGMWHQRGEVTLSNALCTRRIYAAHHLLYAQHSS
jgi:hypothetical protein